MKDFDLWLDESGDFRPESQSNRHRIPSLVGGVLLEKDTVSMEELGKIVSQKQINPENAHAMDFDSAFKREVQLPALQDIVQKGGKLVYFENMERLDDYSHIELYLRLLASGLTQLIQKLAAEYTEFSLSIVIAQKGVPKDDLTVKEKKHHQIYPGYNTALIGTKEIGDQLRHYIRMEWDKGQFDIESRISANFIISDARRDLRLKIADYACNARITRKSAAFQGTYRDQLAVLFENAYIFSVYARTTENEINMALSVGDFGRALVYLYLGRGDFDHEEMLKNIMKRFSSSYRLGKLQLSQFTDDLVTYARNETDFEEVEGTLRRVLDEVFSEENQKNIPYQSEVCEYKIRLYLVDMYLREGDLNEAGKELSLVRQVISRMNYRIENLKHLYFYVDKMALFYINCMDYQKAVDTISMSIHAIENLQNSIADDDKVLTYFENGNGKGEGKLNSEYLGDALCMKIYAEMFMQRSHPEMYEDIVKDSDYALSQYEYFGELERNQQYRAHVEMEHGDYRRALQWLLKTRNIDLAEGEDIIPWCMCYLDEAMNEDPLSRTYYIMYYVEIMYEAARGGNAGSADFAAAMYDAVLRSKRIYRQFFSDEVLAEADSGGKTQQTSSTGSINLLGSAIQGKLQLYHPIEIVWWKWGAYQYLSRNGMKSGMKIMTSAVRRCQNGNNGSRYLVMQVTALAILLEQISLQVHHRLSMDSDGYIPADHAGEIKQTIKALEKSISGILKVPAPEHMKEYIEKVQNFSSRAVKMKEYNVEIAEEADRLSRIIAY